MLSVAFGRSTSMPLTIFTKELDSFYSPLNWILLQSLSS